MDSLKSRLRDWLLVLAHDDYRGGQWHRHHDLLERIAYSWWLR